MSKIELLHGFRVNMEFKTIGILHIFEDAPLKLITLLFNPNSILFTE
jgi:hypothetical protein